LSNKTPSKPRVDSYGNTLPECIAEIARNLYLGSVTAAKSKKLLDSCNIRYVVNATADHPNLFQDQDVHYFRAPVSDQISSPLLNFLPEIVEFIRTAGRNRAAVLIHCNMGISRSATIAIAFCMQQYCWNLLRAYSHIKHKRAIIRPNRGFMEQLIDFEMKLYGKVTIEKYQIWGGKDKMERAHAHRAKMMAQGKAVDSSMSMSQSGSLYTSSNTSATSLSSVSDISEEAEV